MPVAAASIKEELLYILIPNSPCNNLQGRMVDTVAAGAAAILLATITIESAASLAAVATCWGLAALTEPILLKEVVAATVLVME